MFMKAPPGNGREALDQAADYILDHGWTPFARDNGIGEVCALGAIDMVTYGFVRVELRQRILHPRRQLPRPARQRLTAWRARWRLRWHLRTPSIALWNDAYESRSRPAARAAVTRALRAAAR